MTMTISGDGSITGLVAGGLPDATVTTADLVDGAVTPAKTAVGALPSMVRVTGYTGYGSAPNNFIVQMTTTEISQGSDITYVGNSTVGNTFTINTNGTYAITFSGGVNMNQGISLNANSTDTATTINSIGTTKRLSSSGAGAALACNSSWVGYLASGSVLRAHTDGAAGFGSVPPLFTITRVA